MLKKLLLAAAAVVVLFLAYVAQLRPEYRITRTIFIAAPPERVASHVDSFRAWQAWSPWAGRDPAAKIEYAGPERGPGSAFRWSGNDGVGAGTMTITDATPARTLRIRLELTRPYPGTSNVTFEFAPEKTGTRVTWQLRGNQGFIERATSILMFVDLDRMIGRDYEQGLANLKKVVESSPPRSAV